MRIFYQIFDPTNNRMDIEIIATNSHKAIPEAIATLRENYRKAPDGWYYLLDTITRTKHRFKFEREAQDEKPV